MCGRRRRRCVLGGAGGLLFVVAAIAAAQADCATGLAVADPDGNPGLLADCTALLAASERWTGDDGLNWSPDLELDEWVGVTVDAPGRRVTRVALAWQGLEGGIPGELGRLAELEVLDLAHNRLGGSIPAALADLADLELLDLSHNDLTGTIPAALANLADLELLDLAGNKLSGSIPRDLASLADLEVLDLRYNGLVGPIPSELGALADLQTLYLAGNRLSGPIPGELGELADLERLDLAYNRLSGPIPPELDKLTDLELLHLGGNVLSGLIPVRLARLASLEVLDLSGNRLGGGIPTALVRDLGRLEVLDLADNDLEGSVPAALYGRTDLTFDLSGNPRLAETGGQAVAVAGARGAESVPPEVRVFEWTGSSHRIRIDQVANRPRYASWRVESALDDEPDLLLSNGTTIQEVGRRAKLYYLFTTGAYRYVILDNAGNGEQARTGCLFVYQGGNRIRAEPIRPAQSSAEPEPEPGSCDLDIAATIERWLAVPQ